MALVPAVAQVYINTDSLFFKAQGEARLGNYDESRKLAKQVLLAAPEYTDAAVLTGRTYAWQEMYDSARAVLEPLLASRPDNNEVLLALANVELWAGNKKKAIAYADAGLETDAEAVPFLLVKARSLQQSEAYTEAAETISLILELEPEHALALQLKDEVKEKGQVNNIRANYQITTFNKGFSAWQLGSLEYARITPAGKYMGRVSHASRYDQNSTQFELDAYPSLNESTYLYLNAGFSVGSLFPVYRAGAEVYHDLPYKFGVSFGARLLSFQEEKVILYTGHIGKYFKKQWVSFRPFLQNIDGDWQTTGILLIRQYLNHEENHVTLALSQGSTPLNQVSIEEIGRLGSSRIGLETQFRVGNSFLAGGMLSYEKEEYMPDSFRNRYTVGLSVQRQF